jgi:hypothetical protein
MLSELGSTNGCSVYPVLVDLASARRYLWAPRCLNWPHEQTLWNWPTWFGAGTIEPIDCLRSRGMLKISALEVKASKGSGVMSCCLDSYVAGTLT